MCYENNESLKILERLVAIETTMREREKFLERQAREYSRRLEELNHKKADLERNQLRFVEKELYESKVKDIGAKIDKLQNMVYVGVGILLVLQLTLRFFL